MRSFFLYCLVLIQLFGHGYAFSRHYARLGSVPSSSKKNPFPSTTRQQREICSLLKHQLTPATRSKSTILLDTSSGESEEVEESVTTTPSESEGDDDVDTSSRLAAKVAGRKKRVLGGYKISKTGFIGMACLALIKPNVPPVTRIYSALSGPALAAGVAHILEGAAVHDRLSSDTYKRLNVVLGTSYGLLALLLGILSAPQQMNTKFWYLWGVTSMITMINCIKGFGYGVLGWELQGSKWKEGTADLVGGIKTTISGLFRATNVKAAGYLGSTWMVLALMASIVSPQVSNTSGSVASSLSIILKQLLWTAVVFTLKDAADRGRLNGTTFIQLNIMIAAVFGSFGAFLYLKSSLYVGFAAASALASVFALTNGITSYVAKKTV